MNLRQFHFKKGRLSEAETASRICEICTVMLILSSGGIEYEQLLYSDQNILIHRIWIHFGDECKQKITVKIAKRVFTQTATCHMVAELNVCDKNDPICCIGTCSVANDFDSMVDYRKNVCPMRCEQNIPLQFGFCFMPFFLPLNWPHICNLFSSMYASACMHFKWGSDRHSSGKSRPKRQIELIAYIAQGEIHEAAKDETNRTKWKIKKIKLSQKQKTFHKWIHHKNIADVYKNWITVCRSRRL